MIAIFEGRSGFARDFARSLICCGFFYRLAYNSNFLGRGSLEESQKRSRIDLPLHMDLHLLSQNTKICALLSKTRINKLKHHLGPILRSKRK